MRQTVSHSHVSLQRSRYSLWFDLRTLVICAVGMSALVSTACGELEPIVEPEIVDLQLTMDTLKTQVRDAQRNLAEVRTELESRRQELAEAQVARAQLEGRVREAERRVSEARQIIELQREELIAARAERERVYRSSSQLQSQMKQFQRKAPRPVNPSTNELGDGIAPAGGAPPSAPKPVVVTPAATPAVNAQGARMSAMTAGLRQYPYMNDFAVEQQNQRNSARHIFVKYGDTLWSLSRKYRIGLNRLRSINHLIDNQIEVGQILFLSENRAPTGPSPESNR